MRKIAWGVYGGNRPTQRALELVHGLRGYSLATLKSCLSNYMLLGWSGYVPEACRNTIIILPIDYASWLWGWPNRFLQRMTAVHTDLLLRAPSGKDRPEGIDDEQLLSRIPRGFPGWLWTNRIERVGPWLARRAPKH